MIYFEEEQVQLVKTVESLLEGCKDKKGESWGKYKGDVTCRVVLDYIQRCLPETHTAVGPNVYIEGKPTEFDILVVDSQAKPLDFTAAYQANQVHRVVEVKKFGIIAKWGEEYDSKLRRFHETIRNSLSDCQRVKPFYLSIGETVCPKKRTSHSYGDRTRKILAEEPLPIPVYILHDLGQSENIEGAWSRFIRDLLQGL